MMSRQIQWGAVKGADWEAARLEAKRSWPRTICGDEKIQHIGFGRGVGPGLLDSEGRIRRFRKRWMVSCMVGGIRCAL